MWVFVVVLLTACGSEPVMEPARAPVCEPSTDGPVVDEPGADDPSLGGQLIGVGGAVREGDDLDQDLPELGPTAGPLAHGWRSIHFVDVEDAFGAGTVLESALFNEEHNGLRFEVTARGVTPSPLSAARIRMHLPDGTVVDAGEEPMLGMIGSSGRPDSPRAIWRRSVPLPWQSNRLDEAWIELALSENQRFWLEVPYGLVRDPSAPLPESDSRTGPRAAPAMQTLEQGDRIVPFRHVRYEVGEIQNRWRLTVRLSNAFDAHAELELYRDDGGVGQSVHRWDLHGVRTSAEIEGHVGHRIHGLPMLVRLHEPGLRRSDHFSFSRGSRGRRGWGTLHVTVEEQTYDVRIPSSLYLYVHGTADPYSERRITTAPGVLGEGLF